MKKKILSVVIIALCSLMLVVSFAGCRKNKDENKGEGESYPSVFVETGDPIILDEVPLEE